MNTKRRTRTSNRVMVAHISATLLVASSASLGPLSLFAKRRSALFGVARQAHSYDRPRVEYSYFPAALSCRGGADFIDDDDPPSWGGEPHPQQQQSQSGESPSNVMRPDQPPRTHQEYGPPGNPYGPPPHWHQQQPQQQQQYPPQSNDWGSRREDIDQLHRGEPPLPGSEPNQYDRGPPQNYPQSGSPYGRGPYHQHQPRGQHPPPPNLPGGYGQHPPQAVHNAHMQGRPPSSYDEEDDDDLPPLDGEGGIHLPTDSLNDGSADLSHFDKDAIFAGLKRLYRKKIRPLELSSKYGHFHSPPLSPSDFDSKPMVLLLGQYSVGKTSFIRYLLGRDFPGQRIGPEPTTDRFVAILKGDGGDKIIPGAAMCSQADRPFRGLSPFGNNFLSRFEGVEMDSPILNNITLVDTPGILSGQKQNIGRNYDYEQVMKWFAERADLIIIMFDAHKLDISDELKRVIELLKPHQDKMRVLLNKADSISTQQLMRVYGALMWSLGKVMMTPEVCRVYMGSFWGAPLKNKEQAALLTQEKQDLFNDIAQLPQNAVMRRINELVKRARSVKVHAYIIHYLRKQLPYTWGKRDKQLRLIGRLEQEFVMCARRYELPRGDFPDLEPFRQALLEYKDLSDISKLDKKMVKEMDKVFSVDIPNLLEAAKHQ